MLPHRVAPTRRAPGLAGITLATLMLASCAAGPGGGTSTPDGSGSASPTDIQTAAAPSPSSSSPGASIPARETPGRATSERGLPLYAPGDELQLKGPAGEPLISLTVTSLSVEETCPVDGGQPSHGAFAVLDVEATFDTPPDDDARRPLQLSPNMWTYFGTDGTAYDDDLGTTAATSCQHAGNALPDELTSGSSVRGTLVLDIPDETGALTLADVDTDVAEWQLP